MLRTIFFPLLAALSACAVPVPEPDFDPIDPSAIHLEIGYPTQIGPDRAFVRLEITNSGGIPVCFEELVGDLLAGHFVDPDSGEMFDAILQGIDSIYATRKTQVNPGETITLEGYTSDIRDYFVRNADGSVAEYDGKSPLAFEAGAVFFPCIFQTDRDSGMSAVHVSAVSPPFTLR